MGLKLRTLKRLSIGLTGYGNYIPGDDGTELDEPTPPDEPQHPPRPLIPDLPAPEIPTHSSTEWFAFYGRWIAMLNDRKYDA